MMAAGELDKRITIERRTGTKDPLGQMIESWVEVARPWANIRYPSGLATIKAGADVSAVKASIRIRHRSGLDAGMRARYLTEVFDIKAVLPDRRREYIDLVCEVVK